MRFWSRLFLCLAMASPLYAAITTGSIKGVITDEKGPVPLAKVTATSPKYIGKAETLTNENGEYVLSDLTPGSYTVTAEAGTATGVVSGVAVEVDKQLGVNIRVALIEGKGEKYVIVGQAPNVDVGSATVGALLTDEYMKNVPMGRARDVSSALSASPTAGQDIYGVSIGGATSPENTYVIDGINITGASHALLDTRVVLDFIEELQIKEGGYGPEYGRATGGFINIATKGGSNEFHGSTWIYYRPGFLQARVQDIANPGNSFIVRNDVDYYISTGFEIGGPIAKDLLWFHVGYSPEIQSFNRVRKYQWFKGQVAVNGQVFPVIGPDGQRVLEQSGVMSDGTVFNGREDSFNSFTHTHEYTAKVTHLINNDNRHSLSVRGSPQFFSGSDPDLTLIGDPSSFNDSRNWAQNLWGGVYDYAGKFFSDKVKINALVGVHHWENSYAPLSAAGNQPRINYVGIEPLNLLAPAGTLPVPCSVANSFADGSTRCIVQNYRRGGLGFVADENLTRVVEKLSVTNLITFAGLHQIKYGIDFEQVLSKLSRFYTGGGSYTSNQTGNGGQGSFTGQDFALNGVALAPGQKLSANTATFNYGAFIGDSWNPIPSLILNFGVRWELQNVWGIRDGTPEGRTTLVSKLTIPDNIAPRAGFIWDFTGKGKGAFRFNYGRFYESIPLDFNERGFGGESLLSRSYNRGRVNPAGPDRLPCLPSGYNANNTPRVPAEAADPTQWIPYTRVTDPEAQCAKRRADFPFGGEDSLLAPGLKGQYSDEFILSADWEVFPSWVFGVTGIYRYLGNVIEDMSTDGGNTYLIANPGSFDLTQIDTLRSQLDQTTDARERTRLQALINTAPAIVDFPKPRREIWQLQFKVDKKLSDNLQLNASYVLSWNLGNYPGLFSANNGQLDPNITSQFDLPQLILNRDGYLPQDVRHRIKLGGFYKARLKDFGICAPFFFTAGAAAFAQSGTPYEFLGRDEFYGLDEVFILPRGAGGRTPWTWNVDLNVSAGYEFTDEVTLELFGQLYNVFNTQGILGVDNRYTASFVRPITDGNATQLPNLRDTSGGLIVVNPNYGNATSRQAPLSGQLGARLRF